MIAGQAMGSTASALIAPTTRELSYQANAGTANIVPGISDLLTLYGRSVIDKIDIDACLRWNGVEFEHNLRTNAVSRAWRGLRKISGFVPSIDQAMLWNFQGKLLPDEFDKLLDICGLNASEYESSVARIAVKSTENPIPLEMAITLWKLGIITDGRIDEILNHYGYNNGESKRLLKTIFPTYAPSFAYQQFLMGKLPEPDFVQQLKLAGIGSNEQQQAFRGFSIPLSPIETILAGFRGVYSGEQVDNRLRANGIRDASDIAAIKATLSPIPGPSDLVRFALREVWDSRVVERFGYDNEFPNQFQYWMEKQGFKTSEPGFTFNGETFDPLSWAKAYWRAHWQSLSAGQAYTGLHRARGNPNDPATWRIPGQRPFTIEDVRTILKINDYPAPLRDLLANLSYNVLTRVDIRRLQETAQITVPEAVEYYKDRGYVDRDASLLANFTANAARRKRNQQQLARIEKVLQKGYRLGVIGKDKYATSLYQSNPPVGVDPLVYNQLPEAQQIAIALQDDYVTNNIALTDEELAGTITIESLKAIRASYLSWKINEQQTADYLRRIGILEQRVLDYVNRWTIQRITKGRTASVSQVIKWYTEGIIPKAEAAERIRLMGYGQNDAIAMLAQADRSIALAIAKANEKIASTQKQKAAAAKAAINAAKTETKQASSRLSRLGTPTKLVAWSKQGLIPVPILERRLKDLGISDIDIGLAVAEVDKVLMGTKSTDSSKANLSTNGTTGA